MVQTLRFQIINKRFACVSVDKKNAIATVRKNQADISVSFNSTSRYLDGLLNIDNIYFDQMVDRIYPTELQLNRANSSDTAASLLDLKLCTSNGTVSIKIYGKRDDFDFERVNFPILDGDVPGVPHMGYTYLNIRFARAS